MFKYGLIENDVKLLNGLLCEEEESAKLLKDVLSYHHPKSTFKVINLHDEIERLENENIRLNKEGFKKVRNWDGQNKEEIDNFQKEMTRKIKANYEMIQNIKGVIK